MSKKFKLSSALYGHSLDVRCVTITEDNSILTGSRDKTAKLWKPNGSNYVEAMTYRDQKKFVGSVLYLEASKEFPDGFVVTGGNDNIIFIYKPFEPFATKKLQEHTNTVSCLSKGILPNSFLSGSWDTTAKLWRLDENVQKSVVTFSGHLAAIWDVLQLNDSRILSASADKTIIMWSIEGRKLHIFEGHTDCVRGLCDFPELNYFASVSNDATIKIWSYSGENINTLYGHTNFIYSISRNKCEGSDSFITSDEDRSVRFWQNGQNVETINLPAQSVWTVACLKNGDIVTGSSDGVVRIFTRDESRVADELTLNKFNEEVEALAKQSLQEIGGYKVSDLPGKEALYDPGKKPGQMRMIREGGSVIAYTWVEDGDNSHWDKVGDVLGSANKDQNDKTLYEGKSYDFVFSVDVEDGKPPIKLPYNKGQDPYTAAHEFLAKNMLPAEYLEQVVDFILKNSNQKPLQVNNDYVDPFTGSSRYTPNAGTNGQNFEGRNVDPLTGANSYSTSSTSLNASFQNKKYFPQTTYVFFEKGDVNVVLSKLKEYNKKYAESGNFIAEKQLDDLIKICHGFPDDPSSFDLLFELLDWPDELVLPVLDIVRIAVRHKKNNEIISRINNGILIEKMKNCLNENSKTPNNITMALRILSNLFSHEYGQSLVYENRFDLLENVTSLRTLNKNGQIALATFLLNLSICVLNQKDDLGISILADVIPDILSKLDDQESQFRAYVALGTLLTSSNQKQISEVKSKVKLNFNFIGALKLHSLQSQNELEMKRVNCAMQIQKLIAL